MWDAICLGLAACAFGVGFVCLSLAAYGVLFNEEEK